MNDLLKRNPLQAINIADYLQKEGVLKVHSQKKFKIDGVDLKSPIEIVYNQIVQPHVALHVAQIFARIIGQEDILACKRTQIVAGWNNCKIIAYETAKIMGSYFLPVNKVYKGYNPSEINKTRMCLISDVIITGRNTADIVDLLEREYSNCWGVIHIFDFGFNLSTKGLGNIKVDSLLNIKELDSSIVNKWIEENPYLFRKEINNYSGKIIKT